MNEEKKSRGLSFLFKTIDSDELASKTIKWGSLIFLVFLSVFLFLYPLLLMR